MYFLEFELPILPKTVNTISTMHWAQKAKYVRDIHQAVAMVSKKPKSPLKKAKLTLTRHSSTEPDFDGLVSSFKHVIDGLIECGVLENDRMSNIGQSVYRWEKAKMKAGKIHVILEEIV